jgi:hypothetical protein
VFPSSVRIAVALVLFILGTMLMSIGRFEGLLMILGAIYWLFTYVRYGPIHLAFAAYRRGRIDRVAELIDSVRRPRLLARGHRSYYHWMRGAIAAAEGRLDDAYEAYLEAYAGKLRARDRSVLSALLAEIDVEQGRNAEARERLETARSMPHAPELDAVLDDLETRARRR